MIRNHMDFIRNKAQKKIILISNGFDSQKVKFLIDTLNVDQFVDKTYSKDFEKWNASKTNLSVILLDIISMFQCENNEVLFISHDLEQLENLKEINLCSLYPLYEDMDNLKIPRNITKKHIEHLNDCLISNDNAENDDGITIRLSTET